MKLFTAGNTLFKLNMLTLVIVLLCALSGKLFELLIAFFSLALHETAHTLLARALGYSVAEVELLPVGFTAKLATRPFSAWDELMIALAGPIFSFTLALSLMQLAAGLNEPSVLLSFARINLALAVINLLPALPLDGGRMLRAALELFLLPVRARIIVSICSFTIAVFMTGFGAYALFRRSGNITLPIFGAFLFVSALFELKKREEASLYAAVDRRSALDRCGQLRVKAMLVRADITCREALRLFRSGSYTLLFIADSDMRIIGRLTENDVLDCAARLGVEATLMQTKYKIDPAGF